MWSLPDLVVRAQSLARNLGFRESCIDEVGRLLHILTRQVQSGRVGEIGTGCGAGTAWMASALRPEVELYTVEIEPHRAEVTRSLFRHLERVHVLHGDWHRLLDYAPFQLLFADGGRAKEREPETVLAAVAIGGLVVLDHPSGIVASRVVRARGPCARLLAAQWVRGGNRTEGQT